jgi:hypothetical protein
MKETDQHNERVAKLTFASVFPHYVNKVQRKGKSIEELFQVIQWLTGFNPDDVAKLIQENVTFKTFFDRSNLNPNATLIKGVICGYRIEEIQNELTKKVRYLDKLLDELANGKKMEKIMRSENEN